MTYIKKPKRITPVFEGLPRCCDSEVDYQVWKKLERLGQDKSRGFCGDCQPAFQQQMIAENRCQYPQVVFVDGKDREGDRYVYGRLSAL